MSKKRIITISRSFGSGGRMIGEELARRLEYHFYDRNLLDLLSEKTGISEQGLESADEKLPQKILDHYVPTRVTDYNTSHYLFRMESKLIEELAEKECCVFIGRLADWILKDRDDVLNVFITAPDEDRIHRIMETEDVVSCFPRLRILRNFRFPRNSEKNYRIGFICCSESIDNIENTSL